MQYLLRNGADKANTLPQNNTDTMTQAPTHRRTNTQAHTQTHAHTHTTKECAVVSIQAIGFAQTSSPGIPRAPGAMERNDMEVCSQEDGPDDPPRDFEPAVSEGGDKGDAMADAESSEDEKEKTASPPAKRAQGKGKAKGKAKSKGRAKAKAATKKPAANVKKEGMNGATPPALAAEGEPARPSMLAGPQTHAGEETAAEDSEGGGEAADLANAKLEADAKDDTAEDDPGSSALVVVEAPALGSPEPVCHRCKVAVDQTVSRLVGKSAGCWVCPSCNKKAVQLHRIFGSWPPSSFAKLPKEWQEQFSKGCAELPGGPALEEYLTQAVARRRIEIEEATVGGENLPLSVYKARGYDNERIKRMCAKTHSSTTSSASATG